MPAERSTKSPLENLLDEAATKRLADFLMVKIRAVEGQLENYRSKRRIYEAQANDSFEWRRGGNAREAFSSSAFDRWATTIFEKQNDSLNIVGGFAAFITARAIDDFFGTEPYYTIFPEGVEDDDLAAAIQKHSEWKLRMSPWKDAALDAIDCAIGLGEGVLKQTWRKEVDIFEQRRNVLMDGTTKKPLVGPDGDFIYGPDDYGPGDELVPMAPEAAPAGMETAPPAGPTEEALEPAGLLENEAAEPVGMMVKKYGVDETGLPLMVASGPTYYQEGDYEQTNVSYNNVQVATVHYGDILADENEEDFEKAHFIGQRVQMRLSELLAMPGVHLTEDQIKQFESETDEAKTAAAKSRSENGEVDTGRVQEEFPDPLIELVECWMRHAPLEDRKQRRMMVLFAVRQQMIVRMDYIANVTPQGKLPFQVIRAFKVKNRWYGRGYFEIYEKAQEFIDRYLNQVAYRDRFSANPIKFFDPSLIRNGEDMDMDQILEPGFTMTKQAGVKNEDVFSFIEWPDTNERGWQLMQMMIQVVQVRSGITSAAQGEVSSLPSTSTATGIESILQSASTLARQPMNLMKSGLEKSLLYAVKLIYSNMDGEEVYNYLDGDQQKVGTLEAITVKDMEMNVRLLLTRFKQRESLESAEKAIQTMASYVMLPESEKDSQRPLFVQVVKSLGFDNADSIVRHAILPPPVDPATGQPIVEGQPPALSGQPADLTVMPPPDQEQPAA